MLIGAWPWPLRVNISSPEVVSQILAVRSSLAVASSFPSGLKVTPITPLNFVSPVCPGACPLRVSISSPVVVSQIVADPSALLVARRAPSGLKATARILVESPCLPNTISSCPVVTSQIMAVPSKLPLAKRVPSGWKSML